jgi:hypothetical protein
LRLLESQEPKKKKKIDGGCHRLLGTAERMEHLEYSEPKQLAGGKFYTQTIWDEKNKKGYIAILTKKADGTFETHSNDFVKDAMEKLKK